jgi:mRNA-degrading endonuclease RelE of RelBE toxin-antitoxin system
MVINESYQIVLAEEHWRAIEQLPNDSQRESLLTFLRDHAQHTPTQRIPGKTKMLRGILRGYFQFDIDRSYRLVYRVDEEAHEVVIEYVGKHPERGELERRLPRLRR